MKKRTRSSKSSKAAHKADFFSKLWGKSWTLVKSVVDVVREPVLILDKNLRVIAANETFYNSFKVKRKETQNTVVFNLGNGQWSIPALRKLLAEVLIENTFFKGFQVAHEFPVIGRRVMVLNARQIHIKDDDHKLSSPIIVLAIEDVTEMMVVAEELAEHAKKIELNLMGRIGRLEEEVHILRNKQRS